MKKLNFIFIIIILMFSFAVFSKGGRVDVSDYSESGDDTSLSHTIQVLVEIAGSVGHWFYL
jgi:hypothetical protein